MVDNLFQTYFNSKYDNVWKTHDVQDLFDKLFDDCPYIDWDLKNFTNYMVIFEPPHLERVWIGEA